MLEVFECYRGVVYVNQHVIKKWEDVRRQLHEAEYYDAIMKCVERYRDIVSHSEGCRDLDKFLNEFNTDVPLNKLNRWLGYVQGVLIERGFTTVQEERDWTRPLFRPLDFP